LVVAAVAGAGLSRRSFAKADAQQPTFSSKLEAIRVDVLVTDRGGVIRGLQPGDFEIRDNGVPQAVDLASFQQIPLNVILALDTSASVSGERLEDLLAACRALLGRLTRGDKAALLTFSHLVLLRQRLTPDLALVRRSLDEVQPDGETSLVDATHAATLLAGDDGARNLLIVFSDGLDTASWLAPERVLDSARRADIVVYSASSRDADESRFLDDLGKLTGGGLVRIASTKDLAARFLGILDEFRNRYLLSYSPTGVARDGWHRLEVRLKNRRATIRARAGYQAGP
jgi:VWFA-related protein